MHTPSYLRGRLRPTPRSNLEPFRQVLERLDRPQAQLKTILIGGTNGKGSTLTFLRGILEAHGLRVGSFVSPSLSNFHELIAINGTQIPPTTARALADRALGRAGTSGLTLFETATAVALLYFCDASVDVALMEVGWGGRRDATNVCDPMLALITSVDLDHTGFLGKTVEAIAKEKVGIIRPGIPVVTGAQGKALQIVEMDCRSNGSRLHRLNIDFKITPQQEGLTFSNDSRHIHGIHLGLTGIHQYGNAAMAIQAALLLPPQLLEPSAPETRSGLQSASLPGRLEMLMSDGNIDLLFDGAHNPAAARALAVSLRQLPQLAPITLILAIFRDKDVRGIIQALAPTTERLIVTHSQNPRCMPPNELAARVRQYLPSERLVETAASVSAAITLARQSSRGTILLTGTLSAHPEACEALRIHEA